MSATTGPSQADPLFIFNVVTPSILLLIAIFSIFARPTSSKSETTPDDVTPVLVPVVTPRRALIIALLSLAAATYFTDAALLIVRAILSQVWGNFGPASIAGYVIGVAAFFSLAIIGTWKETNGTNIWQTRRVRVFVAFAIVFEIARIIIVATSGDLKRHGNQPIGIPERPRVPAVLYSPFIHFGLSILRLLVILPLYPAITHPYKTFVPSEPLSAPEVQQVDSNATASTSLLVPRDVPFQSSSGLLAPQPQYGTFGGAPSDISRNISRSQTPTQSERVRKPREEINLDPTWKEMGQRIRRLTPYLWPKGDRKLELLALFCLLLLIVGRFVNFLVPWTLRKLVSVFEDQDRLPRPSPWYLVFAYAFLKFLQGSGGLNALRDTAWAPVMQFSDRQMSQMSFDHLLNLSLAFHTRRKTGEILRVLDKGQSINRIFELLLFNILPTFIDIIVALAAFAYSFSWTLSAVIFLVMFTYIVASIALTSWRTKIRRQMNERDIVTRGIHTDCLLNYETVKYFGGEVHEGDRYREAIRQYQTLEFKVIASLNLLNLVQNFIISFGLLVGSLLVAVDVVNNGGGAAKFVFFITYLAQLYGPLNNLGFIYRSINQSLVDTERLLKLLDEPTDINDKPGAPDLVVTDGEIEFRNVSFTYDDRTSALRSVSFKVPKGASVALVGESGSGKSTILRLLYRFYDLNDGHGQILIDGQDIRDVTQASLRRAIGVVPQDSVLFNASVEYNIGYGKFGASTEEVEYAAQMAQMHERILSFPDGYKTTVGERGVRLSGGEKQRVSIARTFLKDAPILLLDEATSALDTTTEKDIQKALQNLLRGRSSLSIAHRLSTIASSDIILVLKDGEIVESGSHRDLLAANGTFAAMWAEQISAAADGEGVPDFDNASGSSAPSGYAVDVTEEPTTASEPQVMPAEPSTQYPDLAPGPVLPPASFHELEVTGHDELKAQAALLNFPSESTPEGESTTVEEPKDEPSHSALVTEGGPSYAAIAAPKAEPEPTSAPVAFPSSDAPISFPSSHDVPVAFPSGADDASSVQIQQTDSPRPEPETSTPRDSIDVPPTPPAVASPGVTFSQGDSQHGSRPATPDPSSPEAKKKRMSTQNIQRLARRISVSGRKASQSAADAMRTIAAGSPSGQTTPGGTNPLAGLLARTRSSKDETREGSSSQREGSVAGTEEGTAPSVSSAPGEPGQAKKKSKKKDTKKNGKGKS